MPLKSERDQTDVRESVSIKVASSRVVQQDTKAFPVLVQILSKLRECTHLITGVIVEPTVLSSCIFEVT